MFVSNFFRWHSNLISIPILVLLLFPLLSHAKFQYTYQGIAARAVDACLQNPDYSFTRANLTMRSNCNEAFSCIMNTIDNSAQSILSAGSSTLGFVPTMLTLLGIQRSELMAVHERWPVLALLLRLTTVNIAEDRIPWSGRAKLQRESASAVKITLHNSSRLVLIVVHIVAALAAGVTIWQTIDLGRRAVLAWACWTSFYPSVWLCLSAFQHFLDVLTKLLNKGPDKKQSWMRVNVFRVLNLFAALMGMVTYIFGTIVLASLTMVSGINAVHVVATYGLAAVVTRACCAWVMETG